MRVVAIDGPAGAGKSTIAAAVADALGWDYVDTGAMYRALALAVLRKGADPSDAEGASAIARDAAVEIRDGRTLLNGEDVSERIRRPEVNDAVSIVSAHGGVRSALVSKQRNAAARGDVVMEGRDIGSVVVPDALLKIFLTASLEERARRRARDLGTTAPDEVAVVERALTERDHRDSSRESSPLIRAPDAKSIDTTDRSISEIVDEIVGLAKKRLNES